MQFGGYGGVLAIAALAAWARWERITASPQAPLPASPLDLPATKGSEKANPGSFPSVWLLAAGVLAGLSGAYSAAGGSLLLVVPLAAGVVAINGRRPCWWSAAIPGLSALACASIVLGASPAAVSSYQFQGWLGNATGLETAWSGVCFLGLIWVLWSAKPRGAAFTWFVAALVASSIHFSPAFGVEGWLAPALRALAIVVVAGPVIQAVITAVSPRSLQAPKRSNPAPGSLLHQ